MYFAHMFRFPAAFSICTSTPPGTISPVNISDFTCPVNGIIVTFPYLPSKLEIRELSIKIWICIINFPAIISLETFIFFPPILLLLSCIHEQNTTALPPFFDFHPLKNHVAHEQILLIWHLDISLLL